MGTKRVETSRFVEFWILYSLLIPFYITKVQGGGLFLPLLTKAYFTEPYCVGELLAYLRLHELKRKEIVDNKVIAFQPETDL